MQEVRNVLFDFTMDGQGIVNYDANDQKQMLKDIKEMKHLHTRHENTSFAKKVIDKDGNYRIKISSAAICQAMFKAIPLATLAANDELFFAYLSSTSTILKGHMFAAQGATFKRKGAITIVDALQTNNALSFIEGFSSSGYKETNEEKSKRGDDSSGNTFFGRENIGEITYASKGSIDLETLSILSCDNLYDRLSFNVDKIDIFTKFLKLNLPNFSDKQFGHFELMESDTKMPELAIKLDDEQILFLVKSFFTKLLSTKIQRRNAYARVTNVRYKLVVDPIADTFENSDGWITLKSREDINAISFIPRNFYEFREPSIRHEFEKDSTAFKNAQTKKRNDLRAANAAKKAAAKAAKLTPKVEQAKEVITELE